MNFNVLRHFTWHWIWVINVTFRIAGFQGKVSEGLNICKEEIKILMMCWDVVLLTHLHAIFYIFFALYIGFPSTLLSSISQVLLWLLTKCISSLLFCCVFCSRWLSSLRLWLMSHLEKREKVGISQSFILGFWECTLFFRQLIEFVKEFSKRI